MAKPSSTESAKRVIALLGRLTSGATLSLAELAEDLGVSASEIARDLEMLAMCGLAPYDPYELVPVMVEDGMVKVFGDLPALTAPIRLSQSEATALVTALQAAGYESGDPLIRRLMAASAASFDPDELRHTLVSTLESHEPSVYEALAEGISTHRVTSLTHAQDEDPSSTCRDVEPYRLFAERGAWYVTAWCRRADDWRTFKLDRISSARLSEESFAPRDSSDVPSPTALLGDELPLATLLFAADVPFVEREWPGATVAERRPDGSVVVSVPYAGTAWIARHVVARFGRVEALGPSDVREAVAQLARSLR